MKNKSINHSSKDFQGVFCAAGKSVEDFYYRLPRKGLSFTKQYLEGSLWIAMQFRPVRAGVKEPSVLALVSNNRDAFQATNCFSRRIQEVQSLKIRDANHWDKDNVLVGNVQAMESIKAHLPAFVRLYLIGDSSQNEIARSDAFFFMSIDGSNKILPSFVEWESSSIAPFSSTSFGTDVISVIKRDSEVVDGISQDGGDVLVKRFGFGLSSTFQRSVLLIGPQSLHVILDVCGEASFEIADVMLGPFDF